MLDCIVRVCCSSQRAVMVWKLIAAALAGSFQVVSTLIPSPKVSVMSPTTLFQSGATHPLARTSRHSMASRGRHRVNEMLVGVLTRLCSRLKEATGLTIRATVSQWTVGSRPFPIRSARIRNAMGFFTMGVHPMPSSQRFDASHNRFTTACRRRQDFTSS